MVAPAYSQDTYVNHDLSINLDSTDAFEGPEKLLEIWFVSSPLNLPIDSPKDGLRSVPLEKWEELLDLVNCKILSMKSSKDLDAYLLSESSLFVFPHKIILKTCGTTTTLLGLAKLFEFAKKYINWNLPSHQIYKIFYSRRSFMFPENQKPIHKNWSIEVDFLNQFFNNGKSYIVGNLAIDHWHLYMAGIEKNLLPSPPSSPIPHNLEFDETFEVLMTELNPVKAENFVTSRHPGQLATDSEEDLGHLLGLKTIAKVGLDNIYDSTDGIIHDAFSFTPCGFSSNSIKNDNYYTLHITPENGWSYASFETNYSSATKASTEVLAKVLSIFEPGKFSCTLIEKIANANNENFNALNKLVLKNYKKCEKVVYDLNDNYRLLYLNFEKTA